MTQRPVFVADIPEKKLARSTSSHSAAGAQTLPNCKDLGSMWLGVIDFHGSHTCTAAAANVHKTELCSMLSALNRASAAALTMLFASCRAALLSVSILSSISLMFAAVSMDAY